MAQQAPDIDVLRASDLMDIVTAYDSEDRPLRLIDALDSEIEKMVRFAKRHGKATKVVMTLEFKPEGEAAMYVSADIDNKKTKSKSMPISAFTDSKGRLRSEDPAQMVMFPKTTPIRQPEPDAELEDDTFDAAE